MTLKRFPALAIVGLCLFQAGTASAQVISTVSGRGPYASATASSVPIPYPWPIAVSKKTGSVYFAAASTVYRFDPTPGTITQVAGNGTYGYSGDSGTATSAQLGNVSALALDSAGNLYIADWLGNTVRKVTTAGIISTVAGTGVAGSAGDGGPASSAQLHGPLYLAFDANDVMYIADIFNGVRKVSSGTITTVAATVGSYPLAVTVDSVGTLYYIDASFATATNDVLRKLPASATVPTTIANLSGQGCDEGLALDASGNLYTTDYCAQKISQISSTGVVTIVAGSSVGQSGFSADGTAATAALLAEPADVAVDAGGTVYFTEGNNARVRKFTVGGTLSTLVGNGNGDGGAATAAPYYYMRSGIAVGPGGPVFIADGPRIRKITPTGTISTSGGSSAEGFGGDGGPWGQAVFGGLVGGLAIDSNGNKYVADSLNNRIRTVSQATGVVTTIAGTGGLGYTGDGGAAVLATLHHPYSVAVDGLGNVFVGGSCEGGFDCQQNIATTGDKSIIRRIDTSGNIATVAGNGTSGYNGDGFAATTASLNHPIGFTADATGNLYIADTFNHRVRKVSTSGIITTVAGNGVNGYGGDTGAATSASLSYPNDVAIDANGNLYISDFGNARIRKVTSGGVISTIAGTGVVSFSGDGGAAASAGIGHPTKLALDPTGDILYFLDQYNYRVRRIIGLLPNKPALATPSSVPFPDQALGTASQAVTIYVQNGGTSALSLGTITLTGTNTPSFQFTTTCTATLAVGAACAVNVTFAPPGNALPGAKSAAVSVPLPAFGSSLSVPLSGNAFQPAPVLSLNTTTLTFGDVAVGTSSPAQAITVTNTGNAPLTVGAVSLTGANTPAFQFANGCTAAVAPGSSCTINVTFAPPAAALTGTKSASVSIPSNAAATATSVSLSGNAVAALPRLKLSVQSLSFGSLALGAVSSAQVVTLQNRGTAPLSINSIAIAGLNSPAFRLTNGCSSSLAIGASCTLTVSFAPPSAAAAGAKTAYVTIGSNSSGGNVALPLTGTAVAPGPILSTASSLAFGYQTLGTSSSVQIQVRNIGSAPLAISSVLSTGTNAPSFQVANNCGAPVPVGGQCTLGVSFAPPSNALPGAKSASLWIISNGPGGSTYVPLSGTAIAAGPYLVLSSTGFLFANQGLGTISSPQTLTLTNVGSATMNINYLFLTGTNSPSFQTSGNTCGATLSSGASCSINVAFSPPSTALAGTKSASIYVGTNAPGSPVLVPLSGAASSQYSIGGTISGLTGSGLVLTLNGANNLTIPSGATSFQFPTSLASGAQYNVFFAAQPAGETCTVTSGGGIVPPGDVTLVSIACVPNVTDPIVGTFSISNTNNAVVTFYADGTYIFSTRSYDPTCGTNNGNGVEYGVYNWNKTSGLLTFVNAVVDTNGTCGLFPNPGPNLLQKAGSGQTGYYVANDSGGQHILTPVASTPSTLTGAFNAVTGPDFVVFFPNNTYLVTTTQADSYSGTPAGLEYGCVSLSGTATVSVTWNLNSSTCTGAVDTNGTAGFSNGTDPFSITITGPNSVQAVGASSPFNRIVPN